jgi:hypothetical protein
MTRTIAMNWKLNALAGAALLIAAAAAHPAGAYAAGTMPTEDAEAARCSALMEQFTRAVDPAEVDDTARSFAERGIGLCRIHHFADGADSLAEAVRLIGQTPDDPNLVRASDR